MLQISAERTGRAKHLNHMCRSTVRTGHLALGNEDGFEGFGVTTALGGRANDVADKIRKERRGFHIPKLDRERSLYGSEFKIQLDFLSF